MKSHSQSITNYTLQVISTPDDEAEHSRMIFKLKEEEGLRSHEFYSAEALLDTIQNLNFEDSDHQPHKAQNEFNDDMADPHKQVELLKILIEANKKKLKELRFVVTDRITSAMTRTTLLKTGKNKRFTDVEEKWLDESLNDLAQLSLAIEEWTKLCEITDPKDLNDTEAVKSMVTNIISLN